MSPMYRPCSSAACATTFFKASCSTAALARLSFIGLR